MILKLPAKHAADWWDRCGEDRYGELLDQTARTVTLRLTPEGVKDLRDDIWHYIECMHGEYTDGVDYRPAARRCLQALDKAIS